MLRIITAAAVLLMLTVAAEAGNLITISTAGGSITVSAGHASKFRGFIADVHARGFRGPIKCYARGGHVRGSLHYRGEACDFAQRGWNKTHRLMYRVRDLAAKWGLRDGCSFRDCGHIDTGARLARGPGRRLVAQARPPERFLYPTSP